jgi:signal transduction histidine kinase
MKRLAANIYGASRRIQEMLNDLLHVSRGKTGETEICRLSEVVAAAVEQSKPAADAQSVAIHVSVPEEIEVPLERARMERVFLNLVHNALEVMPRGGEVRINARAEETQVLIEVADTGPGISPEIRGQLFQPFATFGKRRGVGLGLALSRQSVLDHGGEMWADTGDSPGARFYIRLPMEPSKPAPAGVEAQEPDGPATADARGLSH